LIDGDGRTYLQKSTYTLTGGESEEQNQQIPSKIEFYEYLNCLNWVENAFWKYYCELKIWMTMI